LDERVITFYGLEGDSMNKDKHIHDYDAIFLPFRNNGNEVSLFVVYKALMAKYNSYQAIQLLKAFCLTSTSPENQRKGLEFLYMNSFFQEVKDLIEINKASENDENRQWAQVYEIIIGRLGKDKMDPYTILSTLNNIKPMSEEIELLKLFLTVYSYNDLQQSGVVSSYFDTLIEHTHQIKDPFMSMYFQERLEDFLMFYHLFRNELILCRKYGYRLLKTTHNTYKHSVVHKQLSLTYALDNYEQAIYHANAALHIADEYGYTKISDSVRNNNIPFISAVNGRYENVTTEDRVEQAHLDIARGNIKKAVTYLENIEQRSLFQEYYLGKALDDEDRLMKVYHSFTRAGNHFAAQFPIKEIRRIRNTDQLA